MLRLSHLLQVAPLFDTTPGVSESSLASRVNLDISCPHLEPGISPGFLITFSETSYLVTPICELGRLIATGLILIYRVFSPQSAELGSIFFFNIIIFLMC